MNRADDCVPQAVPIILLGQIVMTYLLVVPIAKSDSRFVTEPGVVVLGKIPKVSVRIYNSHRLSFAFGVRTHTGVTFCYPFLDAADVIKVITTGL